MPFFDHDIPNSQNRPPELALKPLSNWNSDAAIRDLRRANTIQALKLTAALRALLETFNDESLPCAVLRGMAGRMGAGPEHYRLSWRLYLTKGESTQRYGYHHVAVTELSLSTIAPAL